MEITKYILCRVSSHFDFMCMDVRILPPQRIHAAISKISLFLITGIYREHCHYIAKDATPKPMSRIGPMSKQNCPAPWAAVPLLRSPGLTQSDTPNSLKISSEEDQRAGSLNP